MARRKQIAALVTGILAGGGSVQGVGLLVGGGRAAPAVANDGEAFASVSEVRRMIGTESPYVEDRQAIRSALLSLDAIEDDIHAVRENQARILATLDVLRAPR